MFAVKRLANVLGLDVADRNAFSGQDIVWSPAINSLWLIGHINIGYQRLQQALQITPVTVLR